MNKNAGFSLVKLLLPIVFIAAGLFGFNYLRESKPEHTPPVPREKTWHVQVQPLIAERLAPEIEIQGKVEAPDRYRAAAPGAGWVESVNVREGDRVEAGTILVKLDPRDFSTALTQAEAELADIQAQLVESEISYEQNKAALVEEKSILALARKSVARSKQLKTQALSSESALEEAQQALIRQQLLVNQRELAVKSYPSKKQQLEARMQRARAQIEQAERSLERSQAIAPYTGYISEVNVAAGSRVNAGAEMVSMYSPSQLEIRGLIPSRYSAELAAALKSGQVLSAYAPRNKAHYRLLRLAGEAQPGGVDGFFAADKPDVSRITPGELITLMLKRPAQEGLYRVPPTAIYNNARVYLLRDGRLAGINVDIIGQGFTNGEGFRYIRSDAIGQGEQLVLTRLPNATTGLKVKALEQVEQ